MSTRLSYLSSIFTGSALALLGLVVFQQGPDLPTVAGQNLARLLATSPTSCGERCQPPCGNGQLDPKETCDDGNATSGDGCSNRCKTE